MAQKVWLVTGCSSGLGRQLVKAIQQRGDKVVATARNADTLNDLIDENTSILQLDVAASQQILNEKAAEAVKAFDRIDVVVHNAGYFQMGTWEDLNDDLLQAQFATNFFGVVNLTRAIVPHLRERRQGTIVFVNSTAAWQTYAGISSYGASKAALERMVDGLTREVGLFGVKTFSIDAGGFKSELMNTHKAPTTGPPTEHYAPLVKNMPQAFAYVREHPVSDINKVASLIVDLVRGEGVAQGKQIAPRYPTGPDGLKEEWAKMGPNDIPMALPVGSDAFDIMKAKCEMTLKVLEQWEGVIKSTDV